MFTEQRTFGTSRWPFTLARPEAVDYAAERFPGTYAYLDNVLVLPWNERYEAQHVELLGRRDPRRRRAADGDGPMSETADARPRVGLVGAGGIAQTYVQVFDGDPRRAHHRGRRRPRPRRERDRRGRCAAPRTRRTARCSRTRTSTRCSSARRRPRTPRSCCSAIERGLHVLCEKPLAIDVASATAMVAAADAAGVVFTMASKFRFVDDVIRARQIVDSGILGELIVLENSFASRGRHGRRWNSDPAIAGGGVLIDNGTHSVDIVRYFLGPIAEVHGGRGQAGPAPRRSRTPRACSLRTPDGALGTIDLSWSVDRVDRHLPHASTARRARSASAGTARATGRRRAPSGSSSAAATTRSRAWARRSRTSAPRSAGDEPLVDHRRRRDRVGRGDRGGVRVARRAATGSRCATSPAAHAGARASRWHDALRTPECAIHPTAEIEDGVEIGAGTAIWSGVHVRGPGTHDRRRVHRRRADATSGTASQIGDRVKLNAFVYVCTGVTIEDGVMVGAGHDLHQRPLPAGDDAGPRRRCGRPSPTSARCRRWSARARRIGAGCVIGCDLEIGRFALVGMGSVVTRSAPAFHLVVGQPARSVAVVSRVGEPIVRFSGARPPDRDEVVVPGERAALRDPRRRGHRARPALVTSAAPSGETASRWAVVGGGMLGLTLALPAARAGQAGHGVRARRPRRWPRRAWSIDDARRRRHLGPPLPRDPALRRGAARGARRARPRRARCEWVETKTGYYAGGQLSSVSNTVEFLRLPGLPLVVKLRLGAHDPARLAREGLAAARAAVGRDWLTQLVRARDVPAVLAAAAAGQARRELAGVDAAFIWATIQRLYAARRSGLKKEMFGYVPGGYARVLERFADGARPSAASTLRCSSTVARDRPAPTATGSQVAVDGRRPSPRRSTTSSSPATRRPRRGCARTSTAAERARLAAIALPGDRVRVARAARARSAPYYLTYLTDDLPFTAVVEMTALVDPASSAGTRSCTCRSTSAPDDPLFDVPDDEIEARFLDGLQRVYPGLGRDDVLGVRISRVRRVFPIPTLGYSRARARRSPPASRGCTWSARPRSSTAR